MDSGRVDEDQEDDGEENNSGKELPSESQQRRESGLPLRNGKAVEQQETEDTARLGECGEERKYTTTERLQQSKNRRKWCQKVKEEMMWKQQLIKGQKSSRQREEN
ncbi:Hypothetical protein FKW44_019757 [Caligus rogercresseyi]|uniref:Uncharacterized protein n=1 Tax=Caligus rogercresseyi TaxID=217165 RepID=A0A7T8JYC9_CALRO|nr:Hypothetical protein FKW44_019757 [Caligus rogercresseyi]